MEVPQLHGFGPAANRLLEAYNTLLKVFKPLAFWSTLIFAPTMKPVCDIFWLIIE